MEPVPVKKPKRVSKDEAAGMSVMQKKPVFTEEQFDKLADLVVKKLSVKPKLETVVEGAGKVEEVAVVKVVTEERKPAHIAPQPVYKPRPPSPEPEIPSKYGYKAAPVIQRSIPPMIESRAEVEKVSKYGRK